MTIISYKTLREDTKEPCKIGDKHFQFFSDEEHRLLPGEIHEYTTGISLEIPVDPVKLTLSDVIHPLHNVTIINTEIYGKKEKRFYEIKLTLKNDHSSQTLKIKRGTHITDISFSPIKKVDLQKV